MRPRERYVLRAGREVYHTQRYIIHGKCTLCRRYSRGDTHGVFFEICEISILKLIFLFFNLTLADSFLVALLWLYTSFLMQPTPRQGQSIGYRFPFPFRSNHTTKPERERGLLRTSPQHTLSQGWCLDVRRVAVVGKSIHGTRTVVHTCNWPGQN